MDHGKKFLELYGINTLRKYKEPLTAVNLLLSGKYYTELFDNLDAQSEHQAERVFGESSRILAEALQSLARQKYGAAGPAAVRQILVESGGSVVQELWQRQRDLIKTAASQIDLNPEQEQAFSQLMDVFPDLLLDFIATEAARLQLIPVENINEIGRILAEMFKEERHADPGRNN